MKNLLILIISFALIIACEPPEETKSSSGVTKAKTTVQTDNNGNTVEQVNIVKRLKFDNSPGSIKHLYLISPISGTTVFNCSR